MNNIQENPIHIAYRGQLYDGERDKAYGEESFAFGDGEYLSTGYGDASAYAKADPLYNLDLSGNISKIASLHCETYNEAKSRILEKGDGKVLTVMVSPQRMITYGGTQFVDIPDVDSFRNKFEFSLAMCDIPADERTRITNFVIKNNDKPKDVYSRLAGAKALPVLREFAISCNCDAYELSSEFAPVDWVNKLLEPRHIILLNKDRMRVIRQDDPITCDPEVHGLSTDETRRNELIEQFKVDIASREKQLTSNMAVSIAAIREELSLSKSEPPAPETPKADKHQAKPLQMRM